jgi:hypothetical protein
MWRFLCRVRFPVVAGAKDQAENGRAGQGTGVVVTSASARFALNLPVNRAMR